MAETGSRARADPHGAWLITQLAARGARAACPRLRIPPRKIVYERRRAEENAALRGPARKFRDAARRYQHRRTRYQVPNTRRRTPRPTSIAAFLGIRVASDSPRVPSANAFL